MSLRPPVGLGTAVLIAALALATTTAAKAPVLPLTPVPPLGAAGRWLVDATGRVVMLRGVNDVRKIPPFHSAGAGFGEDDVAFLRREGFNALRLGIDMRGLMPEPGRIDPAYLEHVATTVAQCSTAGIFVLLDFHQDGYAPKYNGNGFPDWMARDDGLPNPPEAVFPLYYVQNPAMQRAFEHFWANSPLPSGRGAQDYLMQAVEAVTRRLGAEPMVIGIELINEPWPGEVWEPCVFDPRGCPDQEAAKILPMARRALSTVRAIAPHQLVWVEPFSLFNFGRTPTSLPGTDPGVGLSFHSYAIDPAGEVNVVRFGVEAAVRDGAPVMLTEFGAGNDPVLLARLLETFDDQLLPWMFWAYNEWIVRDQMAPLGPDTLLPDAPLDTLVRPYPIATTGIPVRLRFDPSTRVFEYDYTTARAGGGAFARRLDTVVYVPLRQYPDGYTTSARGAKVLSAPCATHLRLRTKRRGRPVTLRITPGIRGPKARRCRPGS